MHSNIILALAFATSLVLGCSSEKQKPAEHPEPLKPAALPIDQGLEDDEDPDKASVSIDPRLVEMCQIPVPKFAFDSSKLSAQATSALDALGVCLVSGPARDEALRLVGHADPRGTDEYNLALGQRRAASVAKHLETRGVSDSRLETSSRGEIDAVGTDEPSWELDRKVEIFLAD